ncbi:MAG: coproporphyrinogen III oxidase family protein, partial [Eubacteriales bacterium]|nr:coproporphyrinogen III oxidase family protein [Eubacteriales bacterium]
PLQTEESLINTLEFALSTDACHISTYMLKIEENTPFYYNKEGYVFPDEDNQANFYEITSKILCNKGFRHYEISNFCKDDKISRHNMKYWELNDYLGIGPSAHSLIGNKRFFYSDSFSSFENNITTFESVGKTAEEYLMLSLRTDIGFRFAKYKKLFGTSASADLIAEAKVLEKLGFVTVTDESIKLTERGYLLSNAVIGKLLNKGI